MGFLAFLPKIMAIMQLVQVVIPLIKTVEEAVTGKGTGVLKKKMIMGTIMGVTAIAKDANIIKEGDANGITNSLPLLGGLIDMVVSFFHTIGEFTHADEAAPE